MPFCSLGLWLQPQTLPMPPALELAITPPSPSAPLLPPAFNHLITPVRADCFHSPHSILFLFSCMCAPHVCRMVHMHVRLRLMSRIVLDRFAPYPLSQVSHSNTEHTDKAPTSLTCQLAVLGSPCVFSFRGCRPPLPSSLSRFSCYVARTLTTEPVRQPPSTCFWCCSCP